MDITNRHSFTSDKLWSKVATACQGNLPPGWQLQRTESPDHLRVFRVGPGHLRVIECSFQRPCPGVAFLRVLQRLTPVEMLKVVDFAESGWLGVSDPRILNIRAGLVDELPRDVNLFALGGGKISDMATVEWLADHEGKLSHASLRADIFGPDHERLRRGGFLGNAEKLVTAEFAESETCPACAIGACFDSLGWCDVEFANAASGSLPSVIDWFARSITSLCLLIDTLESVPTPAFPKIHRTSRAKGAPADPAPTAKAAIENLGALIRSQQFLATWFIHERPEIRLRHGSLLDFDNILRDFERLFSVTHGQALEALEADGWIQRDTEQLRLADSQAKPDAAWMLELAHKLIQVVIWSLEELPEDPKRVGAEILLVHPLKARSQVIEKIWRGEEG